MRAQDPIPRLITSESAQRWSQKGLDATAKLLSFAGAAADPAPVVVSGAGDPAGWPYGNFMLTWLEPLVTPRTVHYLPDGGFFMEILRLVLQPVFAHSPDLKVVLGDSSRLEMALTNDVLQIQLRSVTRPDDYSMIRHHALMLFYASMWLESRIRSKWIRVFEASLSLLDSSESGRPTSAQLFDIERSGFECSKEFSEASMDAKEVTRLLSHPKVLKPFMDYQLVASAAIGLLWRQYRALSYSERTDWEREQLSTGYGHTNYLVEKWDQA